jgi:hypothetical protein
MRSNRATQEIPVVKSRKITALRCLPFPLLGLLGLFAVLMASSLAAQAQRSEPAADPSEDGQQRLQALLALHDLKLPGAIPTYYTAGYAGNARYTQNLVADEFLFYAASMQLRSPSTVLAVLDAKQWPLVAQGLPYGMPSVSDHEPFVIAMPAEWKSVTALPFPRKEDVSVDDLKILLAHGAPWDEVRYQGGYGVATHEIGHAIIRQLKIDPQVSWFNELLASYIGFAYLYAKHPETIAGNEIFWKQGLSSPHPFTSLAYFEKNYGDLASNHPVNYAWYQFAFDARGLEVYRRRGLEFVRAVAKQFPAGGPRLNSDQVLEKLEAIDPGWKDWAARLEANKISPRDIPIEDLGK